MSGCRHWLPSRHRQRVGGIALGLVGSERKPRGEPFRASALAPLGKRTFPARKDNGQHRADWCCDHAHRRRLWVATISWPYRSRSDHGPLTRWLDAAD